MTLTATLGLRFVERIDTDWALALFTAGLGTMAGSVALSVAALWPAEYLSLGMAYLRRFPTWGEIRKSPAQVRGETMKGLVAAVARERELNDRKAVWVRRAFLLLLLGLVLIAVEAGTLAFKMVAS